MVRGEHRAEARRDDVEPGVVEGQGHHVRFDPFELDAGFPGRAPAGIEVLWRQI